MNQHRRGFIVLAALSAAMLWGRAPAEALDRERTARFLDEDRRIIREYFRPAKGKPKGLPPGLAKRRGNLPPGLQKQLEKNGRLPPGLEQRLQPLPVELNGRLPRLPEYLERVIVERDVILLDRRTNRMLDIIEDVIALATGQ